MRMLAMLLIALAPTGGALATEKGSDTMKINRKADQQSIEGPAENFTGKATISGFFRRDEPSRALPFC